MSKRPTKLYVRDSEAVLSLARFGTAHRGAVADHLSERFAAAQKDGDRLSLMAECYACYMAGAEDLEMVYQALRKKADGSRSSFLALYANMEITEPKSARAILRELRGAGVGRFRELLGLPGFEEWRELGYSTANASIRQARAAYFVQLRELKRHIALAVRDRAKRRLMWAYNKGKHGFVSLIRANPPTLYLVERVRSRTSTAAWVQCIPMRLSEQTMRQLVTKTQHAALATGLLVALYGRIKVLPTRTP